MSRHRACISTSDLIALTKWSDRTIRLKAESREIEWRFASSSRPGRPSREYFVDTLPAEFQAKYSREQLAKTSQALARSTDMVSGNDSQGHGSLLSTQGVQSSGLALSNPTHLTPQESAAPIRHRLITTEEQQAQAEQRLAAIQPLLDWQRTRRKLNVALPDGTVITSVEALAVHIGSLNQVSRATVWNWVKRFNEFGLAGLADKPRSDRGESRVLDGLDQAKRFVLAKHYRDGLTYRMAYVRLKEEWAKFNRDSDGKERKLPSYSAVREYLKNTPEVPEPVKIYGRLGATGYDQKCSPVLVRDFDFNVNDWWISDHFQHDVFGYNDCFPGIARFKAVRPWLTSFVDMRSRRVLGVCWNATPSSQTICTALRPAVIQFGLPKNAYLDNGVDYRSVGKIVMGVPALSGVLQRLGIAVTNALPYAAQSKGVIESWHQTLHLRFDTRLRPFYCGNKPSNRPEECDEVLAQHKEFEAGKRRSTPLLPVSEIMRMAWQWIFEDYNDNYREHSGRGMNGRTPNEVFEQELPADTRTLEKVELLDCLFWKRESRKVIEGGCIELFRERFEPADADSAAELFARVGSDIIVACDPLNIGEAIAVDPRTNEVVARMVAQKLIAQGPISRDQVRASMRTRRALSRAVEQHLQMIGADFESEVDHLRSRAGFTAVSSSAPKQLPPDSTPLLAAVNGEPARAAASSFSGGSTKFDRREIGKYFAEKG